MIARREDPHPGAQLTFTDARALVDLLTRWDDWCDEVEQTLTAGEARGADRFGGVECLPPVVAPTLYCAGRTTSITSGR